MNDYRYINDENVPEILNKFLSLLNEKGKSEKTIKSYKSDICSFLKWMKKKKGGIKKELSDINISQVSNKFIKQISLTDIEEYFSYCFSELKNAQSTINRKIASLDTFYSYLSKSNIRIVESNLVSEIERPKIPEKEAVYLPKTDAFELLDTIKGGKFEKRDFCIFTLFLNCGLRADELRQLNLNSIFDGKIIVQGKGNKERPVKLNDACFTALKDYLEERNNLEDVIDKNALFLSKYKKRISYSALNYTLDKYLSKANINDENVSLHTLRHTFATLSRQNGVDIRELQENLGHKNVTTTQRYAHVSAEDRNSSVYKNPMNDYVRKQYEIRE